MQLLSFSICFAIALHVVVAAPFPATNQPAPWQLGGPVTPDRAKTIQGHITRFKTRRREFLERAKLHWTDYEYHNKQARRLGHDTTEGKRNLDLADSHNRAYNGNMKKAKHYRGKLRAYRAMLDRG